MHPHANAPRAGEVDGGGASMGAFDVLLELLDVYPLLPAEPPLTFRGPPLGWKVFTKNRSGSGVEIYGR